MYNYEQFSDGIGNEREFLSIAIESIGDGVIATDSRSRVVFMNEAAVELTGWNRSEANGKSLDEVFVIVDKISGTHMESPFTVTLRKGRKSGLKSRTLLVSREGREKYISASSAPIKDNVGEIVGVVVVFRDITRIMQAEEELTAEQKNLEAIFEFAPTGMLLLGENMNILRINSSALQILKQSSEDIVNKRIGMGFNCVNSRKNKYGCGYSSDCDGCIFFSIVSLAFDTGEPIKGIEMKHCTIVDDKEECLWYKISAVPIELEGIRHVVLAIEDITENKRNEEGLKRYQLLSEKARDIIIFVDTEGNIIEANEAAFNAYGYSKEEFLGEKSVFDLRRIKDRNSIIENLNKANTQGILFETEHIRKNGSTFPVEVSSQGTTIGDKRVILSIIRDITERKKAERQLKQAMEVAEAASKAKSEFLANMSHEIRTPLNGIIGMTDLTLITELSKEQKENLVTIKTCADTLHRVINDILDLSKIEAGKMIIENIKFDIRDLIDKTLRHHSTNAQLKGLNFQCQINSEVPEVLIGDSTRLQQVLNNLVGNAVKFTDYGEINIQIGNYLQIDSKIFVKFSISDTGIGIAQEEMRQLFKNFSQVDGSITRKYGGTGLGLAISKHLVEMMGGSIWLKSEKGKGSTFYFTIEFEIDNNKRIEDISNNIYSLEKTKNSLEILIVDDDKVNQILTSQLLEKKGHRTFIANNGIEALLKLKEKHFDLILMDIQMPEMDGMETTRRIRKVEEGTEKHIPIFALTAYALEGDRERFLSVGMDYYLSKPISIDELLNPIEKLAESKSLFGITHGSYLNESKTIENPVPYPIEKTLEENKKTFVFEAQNGVKNIKAAYKVEDIPAIERYAHKIKLLASSADNSNAKNIAFKIELAARKDDLKQIHSLLDSLEEEIKRAETE